MTSELDALRADNARLRELLEWIAGRADEASEDGCGFVDAVADIEEAARAALAKGGNK